jgi:hypothetical protein
MRRQQILGGGRSCHLWAIVEEAALRSHDVGAPVMRAQIRHLIEAAERPDVALQIMRDCSVNHDTIREPLTAFRFAESHLGDVVFLGPKKPGGLVLHEWKDVQHYNQQLSRLAIRACKPHETVGLLHEILADS